MRRAGVGRAECECEGASNRVGGSGEHGKKYPNRSVGISCHDLIAARLERGARAGGAREGAEKADVTNPQRTAAPHVLELVAEAAASRSLVRRLDQTGSNHAKLVLDHGSGGGHAGL